MVGRIYKLHEVFLRLIDRYHLHRVPKLKKRTRKIFMRLANWAIIYQKITENPKNINKSSSNINRKCKLIISLTTFPYRINHIHKTIKTLITQSSKPDKIILWLSELEFPKGKTELPQKLLLLEKYGLEIRFVGENLKSHKKYFYAMKEFPESIILTVDDDKLYPKDLVETLEKLHSQWPYCVCCTRGHIIQIDEHKRFKKYKEWIYNPNIEEKPSAYLCPTGVGGVLYPPQCLDQEVLNSRSIKTLCLNADDLWLKFMAIRKGTKAVKSSKYRIEFYDVYNTQKIALNKTNVNKEYNDRQLKNICSYYDFTSSDFEE